VCQYVNMSMDGAFVTTCLVIIACGFVFLFDMCFDACASICAGCWCVCLCVDVCVVCVVGAMRVYVCVYEWVFVLHMCFMCVSCV